MIIQKNRPLPSKKGCLWLEIFPCRKILSACIGIHSFFFFFITIWVTDIFIEIVMGDVKLVTLEKNYDILHDKYLNKNYNIAYYTYLDLAKHYSMIIE